MRTSKLIKQIIFVIIGLVLMSCQTNPYIISESYLPVKEHRKAIVAAIGPARVISQNGREISSQFHDRNFKYIDEPNLVTVRYYTKVSVLGSRRPYEVSVEVLRERKDPETKEFYDDGLDERLSQKRLAVVESVLNQSREKPQSIDVENPF